MQINVLYVGMLYANNVQLRNVQYVMLKCVGNVAKDVKDAEKEYVPLT